MSHHSSCSGVKTSNERKLMHCHCHCHSQHLDYHIFVQQCRLIQAEHHGAPIGLAMPAIGRGGFWYRAIQSVTGGAKLTKTGPRDADVIVINSHAYDLTVRQPQLLAQISGNEQQRPHSDLFAAILPEISLRENGSATG